MRQINSSLVSVADHLGIVRDVVDIHPVRHVVEERIAGLDNTAMQIHAPVFAVALEKAAIKGGAARTVDAEIVVDRSGLKRREGHDRLEGGPGRLLCLDGAVHQRMIGVVQQHLPILRTDAAGKQVGIERGPAHHGEHFAGSRVESHHRATAVFHGQLGYGLQIQIDGELQALSGDSFLVVQDVALVAEAIHFHAALPVHTHQNVVVLVFKTVFADDVALVEASEFGCVQLGFAHFTDVSDDMRRQAVAGIQAVLHVDHFQLREGAGILMRVDKRQLAGR